MNRRQLLLASAGAGALRAVPAAAAVAAPPTVDGFPMPRPENSLPPRPVRQDPARTLLELGWRFHEGDIAAPAPAGHAETYLSAMAGNAIGAAAVLYDDSDWAAVRVPHDWAAAQPFVESANISQGYRPRGIGWYRRTLLLDPADRGKTIELHFDGIATNATIWVNGSVVAHSWSGYASVYADITPFATFGDEPNVIAIRVDASAWEGWWYEGAGLYRHAWLVCRAPVAIISDGVYCDPRRDAAGRWQVPVVATLANSGRAAATVTVEATLFDPDGHAVQRASVAATVPVLEQADATLTLDVGDARLWSVETPTLYTLRVHVLRDGGVVDVRQIPIGFRTIRFDAERGFFLNERPVKIKGVCLHQDHAGVGTAMPDALLSWRLQRLKAMGCNAVRMSSNAPTAELLDYCDRMGLLVMDENRRFNPSPDYLAQLEWLVRRDRNHPSVIIWTLWNEEPLKSTPQGVEMTRRMVAALKRLDDARPVTVAMNGAFNDPVNTSTEVDVTGFNYYQDQYDVYHRLVPTKPIISTEDTSAYQTRGAFESDPKAHIATSYDREAAGWGAPHGPSWKMIADRPFVAGGFVWTGFDYHGEPTPYEWPTISSFFGILDLCGFPKTAFGLRSAQWIDDAPVLSLAPHWTWPGREGHSIDVVVMSNAEQVTVSLNGRELGTQAVDRFLGNHWKVPYAPGRIEVVARRGGRIVARAAQETAGRPVALRLTPARGVMAGDGEDVQPVTVDAIDAKGRHVPTANLPARFTVAGAAIIGLGNGDPNSHEPEQSPPDHGARSLFNGLAQVIVRAEVGRGRIVMTAQADGLAPARLMIDRLAIDPPGQVPAIAPQQRIAQWRRSAAFDARPSPDLAPSDGDNNSWAFVRSGTPTPVETGGRWRVYRAAITPWRAVAAGGGMLRFAAIGGRAELWVDGKRLADKADGAAGPLSARVPAGAGARRIVLVIEADAGGESGILGPVTLAAV
ncbi:beta-galactosidase GalA [Sphingomonas echinoides]|uniref:Beta-galactosidase GalA n=1 Tax=Sphingomonas echinoides TaxID=59803 RepID=A0ABU4PRR0_9SPHN|nr:beta-galactosidase GalA [Sphingomonas echinoides]MDX5986094.1 beta-galactosidase GalA [Sphingomonas echinoides]